MPTTPWPGRLRNSDATGSAPTSARAASATALATGCSLASSTAPASRSTSAREAPFSVSTPTSLIRPSVTVPVLSRTIVVARRVCSSTSGPLIRTPSWAPRPEPTRSAVGVASPSAQGHAMISTATAAANAEAGSAPVASQKPSVASCDRDHDRDEDRRNPVGEPLHGRLARLRLGDEPTDLGDRGVGADVRRADDQAAGDVHGRPDRLVAGADLDGNALAGQQRRVDGRLARLDHAVGGDLLARPDDEEVADAQLLHGHAPLLTVRAEDGDVLRAELEQRLHRGAGAALGARLEVPAQQDQHRHHGGDLEVELPLVEAERDQRPAPGGERADRDQRVHRRGAVARVHECRAVEGPATPEDDRRREQQRDPLPALELQRRDHREREHGQRQHRRDEPGAAGARPPGRRAAPRRPRHAGSEAPYPADSTAATSCSGETVAASNATDARSVA